MSHSSATVCGWVERSEALTREGIRAHGMGEGAGRATGVRRKVASVVDRLDARALRRARGRGVAKRWLRRPGISSLA